MFRQSFCYYLHQVVSSRHDSRQYSNIILQTHGENRGTRIYMHVALQLQQLVVSCRSSQFSQKFALIKANCIRSAKLNTLLLGLLMSTFCYFSYVPICIVSIRFLKILSNFAKIQKPSTCKVTVCHRSVAGRTTGQLRMQARMHNG